MRIEQLEYLLEINRQSSMKAAAEILHMTPQALSSSIKSLEDELSIKIFHRSNKGISLTQDGKETFQFAELVVNHYYQLLQTLNRDEQLSNNLKGSLALYVAPVFLESIFPAYITKFKGNYPNVTIEIIQRSTRNICEALSQTITDNTLGAIIVPFDGNEILYDYLPKNYPVLSFQILNRNTYYACVPNDSPLARQKTISIKKLLSSYPIVDYCAGNAGTAPLIPLLKAYMPNFQTSLVLSSITVWAEAIQNHMGVGFINSLFVKPDSIIAHQLESLVLLQLKEPLITYNCLVCTQTPSPAVSIFLEQFPKYLPQKNDPSFFKINEK